MKKAVFNPVLTSVLVRNFAQMASVFVAPRLAPTFSTAQRAAQYPVWNVDNEVSVPDMPVRKPGAGFQRLDWALSDDMYNCVNRGIEAPVDDDLRKIYAQQLDADRAAITRAQRTVLVNWERRVKGTLDAALAAGNLATTGAPSTKWDAEGSTPVADLKDAKNAFHLATGMEPNTLTLPRRVAEILERHEDILSRIRYTGRPEVANLNNNSLQQLMQEVFGIQNVIIAGGIQNTANEGKALSLDYIWGTDVFLSYTEAGQDLSAPNFMRTFVFDGTAPSERTSVETYREEGTTSDVHRIRHFTDEKLTGNSLGMVVENTLTA